MEVDGEYVRFLGRTTDIINVGGEKVYPTEVEDVVSQFDEVAQVTVYSEPSPLVGQMVCAKVSLRPGVAKRGFSTRLKQFCRDRLQSYKIPVKVVVVEEDLHSERFKKKRVPSRSQ